MKMSKIISVLLVVIMMSCLSACTSDNETKEIEKTFTTHSIENVDGMKTSY